MGFDRITCINSLLQYTPTKAYLEIGIRYGDTLAMIDSPDKTGVDPQPQLEKLPPELAHGLASTKIFQITSDNFFLTNKKKFDVIFIDGLHLYEQVLADISNGFKFLNEGGFIVLHDCCPVDAYSAIREQHDGLWFGDVWKVIPHIKRDYPGIGYVVIDEDRGLGILWKKSRIPELRYDEKFVHLSFDFYLQKRKTFQNLIAPSHLPKLLSKLIDRVGYIK